MTTNTTDHGHGDSIASWAAVIIVMVGFAAGTLAFWFDQPILVIISAVIAALGAPVGIYLKRAGYGVGGTKSKSH